MLLGDGKADEAAVHAKEAVKLEPESPASQYTLGLTAMARNDTTGAEQAFQEVLKINPRAAVASLQIARLHLARGETAGALRAAEEVSRERPDDVEAAVLLSRSLRAQGDVQRAQRELAARIARQPDQAALRLEMGWVALQRGDVAGARASFDQALRLAPQSYRRARRPGHRRCIREELEAARAKITSWRRTGPDDPRLRLLSARVDLAGGKTEAAERELRELVTADPSQLDAYDLLGRIAMSRGQLDRALAEYKALADRWIARRTADANRDDRGGSRTSRRRARQLRARAGGGPRAGVAANNLAWLYADDGRLDEALKLATVAQEEIAAAPRGRGHARVDLPPQGSRDPRRRRFRPRALESARQSGLSLPSRACPAEGREHAPGPRRADARAGDQIRLQRRRRGTKSTGAISNTCAVQRATGTCDVLPLTWSDDVARRTFVARWT